MEDLFSTKIVVNNDTIVYRVIFDKEKYIFVSEAVDNPYPLLSFVREHDEWHEDKPLPPEIGRQALQALEQYLLKQH